MHHLPRGTVTLLFTDMEGSTRLLQQLGERYTDLLEEYRQLLRAAFQRWNGHEVDSQGDAFFVAFARATDAVSAAVAAQRALASHVWPEGVVMRVRMGLHTGEPTLFSEGYTGLDVHHAALLMSAGHRGQVLLSQTTRDLVEHDLPPGVSLLDLGAHRLKDLQQKSHLSQLVIADLPADFPPLKPLDTHPNNLPVQPTPLIGRAKEVALVQHELLAPLGNHAQGRFDYAVHLLQREGVAVQVQPWERMDGSLFADGPRDPLNQFLAVGLHPLGLAFRPLVDHDIHKNLFSGYSIAHVEDVQNQTSICDNHSTALCS